MPGALQANWAALQSACGKWLGRLPYAWCSRWRSNRHPKRKLPARHGDEVDTVAGGAGEKHNPFVAGAAVGDGAWTRLRSAKNWKAIETRKDLGMSKKPETALEFAAGKPCVVTDWD